MDEDRLTPQMGRLIDQAKAAAQRVTSPGPRAEGIALLGGDGTVYAGYPGQDPALPQASAAETALLYAQRARCGEILAAAVAVANDPAETTFPGDGSRAVLAGIDPDLPLVVKYQGRWVLLLLSQLPSPECGS